MSYQENKPYVVSADSRGLLTTWARKNQLVLPNEPYFIGMLKDLEAILSQYFEAVDIVPEELLREGMNNFIKSSSLPVISLDRAYVNPKQRNLVGFLDATRTVDTNLSSTGLGSRTLEDSLEQQVQKFAIQLKGQSIALADDVIFEGKTMLELVTLFKEQDVIVDTIYSGITIQEGRELLEANGVEVKWLKEYGQVIDEICQRDFVVGTPLSGRTVITEDGEIQGVPYIYPFGKPVEWASIPQEYAMDFSLFCLYQSMQLWAKTEQLSRQEISTQQIAKPVFGLPKNKSMSNALRDVINTIK